jgi:putative RecB family exonuclease
MEEAAVVPQEALDAVVEPSPDAAPPRARIGTPVDGERVLASLSPSRAGDFKTCALMYRFRTIDDLPEQPSPGAIRGTVVHKVLEDLFDLPAAERTPERAAGMVRGAWDFVLDAEPELADMFAEDPEAGLETSAWLASCRDSLQGYFDLEDPRRLEPAEREVYVEALLDSRLLLRGFVDRIDIAPDGSIRVVDYKTGNSPGIGFESKALFQMRFYALVIWRTRGVVPKLLQLIYLGDGQVVSYRPDEDDLRATERLVEALWRAIEDARRSGEWLPSPGAYCKWCSFQEHCPAFGNQPPPLPVIAVPGAAALQPESAATTGE